MDQVGDAQYERVHRRLALRAVAVTAACGLAALEALLHVPSGPASAYGGDLVPASTLPVTVADTCTRSDMAKPRVTDMPIPEAVASTLVVRPAPGLEQLSPPLSQPKVSAAAAWSSALRFGFGGTSPSGSAHIYLGELYEATPAVVWPDRTLHPLYDHTLVWAVLGVHQPEPAAGEGCMFESTMFYVDAATGRSLVGEVFPPPASPYPAE